VILLVIARSLKLRSLGIHAVQIGKYDKKEFLILPFVLLYLYVVLASLFGWFVPGSEVLSSPALAITGGALCVLGLALCVAALFALGRNFRVGRDETHPGELVTRGVFAVTRNPIYLSFILILTGVFLTIPNWILLLLLFGGIMLFHRQMQIEEKSLLSVYGAEYTEYCKKVGRYF
jgi:protein-S-isoprenylcysteine O-methyltransferase Ste14